MIKNYCDKCEAEIQKNELPGQITYLERQFPLDKNTTQPAQVKTINKVLCERCITKLRKYL